MKKTLMLKVNPARPDKERIKLAADFIKKGGLVAFPTETVYGLGTDALNAKAVRSLFRAKQRPLDNPPIIHIAQPKELARLVKKAPKHTKKLVKTYWPGPLTLIFKRSPIVPSVTVAGLDTIAVRMPRHKVALALIRESGCPIAAPSANLAGKPSPTLAKHVWEDLNGRIDAILDAGSTEVGVESTVLDLTVDPPQILRPGGISFEALQKTLRRVELGPTAIAEKAVPIEKARSPGVMHKHYAPNADLVIVEGKLDAIVKKTQELIADYQKQGERTGVLASDETAEYYAAHVVKSLGSRSDPAAAAESLFRLLREFDAEGVDIIIAEGVTTEGLGLAVLNRLRKAAGYKIIKA